MEKTLTPEEIIEWLYALKNAWDTQSHHPYVLDEQADEAYGKIKGIVKNYFGITEVEK